MKIKKSIRHIHGLYLLAILPMSLFTAFLTYASFSLVYQKVDWLIVLVVSMITFARVLRNVFYEKSNNIQKTGEVNEDDRLSSIMVLTIFWLASVFSSFFVFKTSHYQSIMLIAFIILGLLFPYCRKSVYSQMILSATVSSLPVLLVLNINDSSTWKIIFLFLFIFFISVVNQILEDVENLYIDKGYKKTLFTEKKLDEKSMLKLAGIFILPGLFFCMFIFPKITFYEPMAIFVSGFFICFCSFVSLVRAKYYFGSQKRFLYFGVALILTALSISS